MTVTADPNERISDLKVKLQRPTGVHISTQRLVFAGMTLKNDDLVKQTPLTDGASVFVMETKVFPATLGPFKTLAVPFGARDFETPPSNAEFESQGCMWLMEQRALARQGVRSPGAEFPLCGQFSPPHPVTLTPEEKVAVGIPDAATKFVWSYPVAAWNALNGGPDAVRSFLSVGGYVYLDDQHKILHVTTLVPLEGEGGGLQFGRYAAWRPEWTASLMRQGRFQRITIRALVDVGAHHFCWLRPGETLRSADGTLCTEQPCVPHGGFAYLFHEDVFSTDPDDLRLDRVFACTSGDDYVAPTVESEELPSASRTFDLVSELAQIHDERPVSAEAAPSTELQERINHLERQLDAAVKCVACLVEDKDTILNCGHICMCAACAGRVTRCPICRTRVTERRRAFQG